MGCRDAPMRALYRNCAAEVERPKVLCRKCATESGLPKESGRRCAAHTKIKEEVPVGLDLLKFFCTRSRGRTGTALTATGV